MSKSVLVTGATAKTGSEVVKGLIARGETVKRGRIRPKKPGDVRRPRRGAGRAA